MAYGSGIWNVPWLNENSQRNYPLSEEATLKDVTGSFKLPLSLIVDFVFPVHATFDIEPDLFHLLNVGIFGDVVTITIGYNGSPIGSVSVSTTTHEINQSYFIHGSGDFFDSIGKITVGDLTETVAAGGSYNFDVAGGRFEPTTIRPNIKGVTAMVAVTGQDRSDYLQGDIELVAGRNIEFTVVNTPGENPRIRIDAVSSTGLEEDCICGNLTEDGQCISTINGVAPDADGNIELVSADDCLEIATGSGEAQLLFRDKCSKSCCGCEELDTVVSDMNILQAEISAISGVANRLDASVSSALINLISSKTNDLPC